MSSHLFQLKTNYEFSERAHSIETLMLVPLETQVARAGSPKKGNGRQDPYDADRKASCRASRTSITGSQVQRRTQRWRFLLFCTALGVWHFESAVAT